MRGLVLIAALGLGATGVAAAAAPAPAYMTPIKDWIAAFNRGDVAGAKAAHEANPVIIDEPPPYFWSGKDAFDKWAADEHTQAVALGRTEEKVTLGKLRRAEVTGNSAYVIVGATYSYVEKGVATEEPSQMTYALRQTKAGWKIAGWAWTGPRGRPVAQAKADTAKPS